MAWLPDNKYAWDFWFAEKDGELHLFYLQALKSHCNYKPEARHNLASVGHAVLTAWGWRDTTKTAFAPAEGAAWDNLSIWTGSIIQNPKDQRFYLFYTSRNQESKKLWTPSEWQHSQQIGIAVSDDLYVWHRLENVKAQPIIANPGRNLFDGVTWRDPYVIRDEKERYYAFLCARLNPDSAESIEHITTRQQFTTSSMTGIEAGGTVVYQISDNLEDWSDSQTKILIASDEFYQMEVPQVFWRRYATGKRFYLLFCAQEKDCSRARHARMPLCECGTGTYYKYSQLLPFAYEGIPELQEPARLLAEGLYAGKLLNPETVEQPPFFGFVWADEGGHFIGGLSDPIPTLFNADGTIQLLR